MKVIAGGGGHALEVFEELKALFSGQVKNDFLCYDQDPRKEIFFKDYLVIHTLEELRVHVQSQFLFCLGIGNSSLRKKVYNELIQIGGVFYPVHSTNSIISSTALGEYDAMAKSFIGPNVTIGLGSLINVGANVHHDCVLGDFVEIGPGALILGNATIGEFTQIGAGAVVLPGISIGKNCVVGAGAIVTRDLEDGSVGYGVPFKTRMV